jgi:hypothetical protein
VGKNNKNCYFINRQGSEGTVKRCLLTNCREKHDDEATEHWDAVSDPKTDNFKGTG